MMDPDEATVVIDTKSGSWQETPEGVEVQELFRSAVSAEEVFMERWAAGLELERTYPGGGEYFVLQGKFADEHGEYETGTWLRLPAGASHRMRCMEAAVVWIKRGHLGK
jgi:anti-sigma factor ChrR (cupin superfamily)